MLTRAMTDRLAAALASGPCLGTATGAALAGTPTAAELLAAARQLQAEKDRHDATLVAWLREAVGADLAGHLPHLPPGPGGGPPAYRDATSAVVGWAARLGVPADHLLDVINGTVPPSARLWAGAATLAGESLTNDTGVGRGAY